MNSTTNNKQLIIIDSQVNDWQNLVSGISSDIAILVLDASSDGLTQINNYLAGVLSDAPAFQSIYIISHGNAGSLFLGSTSLNSSNLNQYASQLATLGNALTDTGDLLLYGCNVADGETGLQFINQLANLTNADVAASNDLTGSALLGGNWTLEASTGAIEAALPLTTTAINSYANVLVDDYAANTSTTGVVSVGGSVTGNIETQGDVDWFKVSLIAGQPYKITLANSSLPFNSFKGIYDSAGTSLGFEQNGGMYSSIVYFRPITTADYYLAATGASNFWTGTYSLTVGLIIDTAPEPEGIDKTITTNNGAYIFTMADFAFTDVNDTPANTLKAVKFTTLPSTGVIKLYDSPITAGQFISALNIASGNLSFTANTTETNNISFTFQVQDNGSGLNIDPTPNTMTILPANHTPNFGVGDGKVSFGIGSGDDAAHSLAVQADDKILLVGYTVNNGNYDFSLARLNPDGTFDLTFDGDGKVTTAVGSGEDRASQVLVQDDGKILVLGSSFNGGNTDFALVRYNPDGSLDSTFGSGGKVMTALGAGNDYAFGMAIDANGKIVVTGNSYNGSDTDLAVVRYNNNGTLDTSFSGDGIVVTHLGSGQDDGNSVAIQTDGKIVIAGSTYNGSNYDFALLRYNVDGNLDTGFNGTGIRAYNNIGNDFGYDVTIQPSDGQILIAGSSNVGVDSKLVLLRFAANGIGQPFASNYNYTGWDDSGQNVTVQTDGKILVSGYYHNNFAVIRLNSDLSSDSGFGTGGKIEVPLVGDSYGQDVGIQSNGKILLGGTTVPYAGSADFAIIRLTANGTLDPTFDTAILNGQATYRQGGTAVVLDSDVNLQDTDLDIANNYNGSSLTLSRHGGASTNDQFSGSGTLALSGGSVTVAGTVVGTYTQAGGTLSIAFNANATSVLVDNVVQHIAYKNTADAPGTNIQIDWSFNDGNSGSQGTGGALSAPGSSSVAIVAGLPNHPPSGTDKTVTLLEDTTYTFAASDFGFSDVDGNSLLAVKIGTLPTAGTLKLNGIAVSANASINVADINAGKLTFSPAANANGNNYASFSFQVQDNGGTANGGVDLDATAKTLTVNVTPVNDAPAGANKTVTTLEDNTYTLKTADFGFSDPNDTPPDSLLAVKIASLPAAGTLTLNGVAVSARQLVSATDIAANKLAFNPAANANGLAYASLTFQVQDNGGTANGDVDLDPTANTLTVNVTSVNDAPAGADKTVTTLEDITYTLKTADFGFSDPNDTPADSLLAVKIASLPAAGTLTLNGSAVTDGQFVSATDIAANKLAFNPATNANGLNYASLTFQVQDNGGTANGGVDLDPSPNRLTVNVTPVNDAPAGTDNTVTTLEDTAYTLKTTDFGFSDPNDIPADSLLAVKIASLPAAGTLTLNGSAVNAGQFVSATDIAANKLAFNPATNANGLNYASLMFQVQDNGGTANGGFDLDSSANTLTVNITPVNDAPTLTNIDNPIATGNQVTVTFADLQNKTDTADVDGVITAFVIKVISSGTLKIGTSAFTATAWATGTNDVVDATHQAYWILPANASGTLNAFTVAAKDAGRLESASAQATVAVVAETIRGTAGNDTLPGTPGDEAFDGGAGLDTVIYTAVRSSHAITQTSTGFTVSGGADGTDTLTNIERLQFSDGNVALDIDGNAGQVYRLYQAAFDRQPDKEGLGYWINQRDHGASLEQVASSFINSDEFTNLYDANPTNEQFVTNLYDNVLHRDPDQAGFDYWVDALASGRLTRDQVLVNFSESPENQDNVIGIIENGFEYTPPINQVTGTPENDRLTGTSGNDAFAGGLGLDTVIYTAVSSKYVNTKTSTGFTVSGGIDGTDTLTHIERLQFSDSNVALDIDGNAGQVYRLYQAAFDRQPDTAGLGYWINQMDHGTTLEQIASGFINSAEFSNLYGANPTTEQFVTNLYDNVLHRAPDQAGFDYWVNALASGSSTRDQVLAEFSESAENQANVIGIIGNGIDYALWL